MLVVADDPRREARSEDVPVAVVPPVEALSVLAVEVLHAVGEPLDRRLDDQVVVRAHEAEGVAVPEVALDCDREHAEEAAPVVVVQVDESVPRPARRDVEDSVRKIAAKRSRHAADGNAAHARSVAPWTNRHAFATLAMAARAMARGETPGRGGLGRVSAA